MKTLVITGLGYDICANCDPYSAYQIATAIVDANKVNTGNHDLYTSIVTNQTYWYTYTTKQGNLTIKYTDC